MSSRLPARGGTPPPGRRRSLWLGAGAVLVLIALGLAGSLVEGWPLALSNVEFGTVWLCRPGMFANPCSFGLAATAVEADGAHAPARMPASPDASRFDCFYVYPTVEDESAGNAAARVTRVEKGVAVLEAAPFSQVCDVWAPAYRSQTSSSVMKGLAGDRALMRSTFTIAYDSVLTSWRAFLAHADQGRPIILIGDSQGSAILIHLIATQIDHEPSVLRRLVVAIIVGGNLQVPTGHSVGATFTNVPLCESAGQTGCAIAFSSYPSEPPADSVFGRPGQGVSLQSGQTVKKGQQVACTNPAALGGGAADVTPYFVTVTQTGLKHAPRTPWVTYPDMYTATCAQAGGATWLQVAHLAVAGDTRPLVNDAGLGPAWGYHADEFNLTLGNLLADVATAEAAWQARH